MPALQRFIIGLVLLTGVLAAVAFALPRQVAVARSTVINAPESDIFPYLNSPRKFNEWSPWAARDPETEYEFTGPEAGKGAGMRWKSEHPQVGEGRQEIVESDENKYVEVALDFGDMGQATGSYTLSPSGAGTQVKWAFETDVGNNPLKRWFGLTFEHFVGKDYEDGLSRLKTLVESGTR